MNKVVRDGKVAVLYSPGFGAGWYTWNDTKYGEELVFDPGLVALVEQGKMRDAVHYAETKWPEAYTGGVDSLDIEWLPQGIAFRIDKYDGRERVVVPNDLNLVA